MQHFEQGIVWPKPFINIPIGTFWKIPSSLAQSVQPFAKLKFRKDYYFICKLIDIYWYNFCLLVNNIHDQWMSAHKWHEHF